MSIRNAGVALGLVSALGCASGHASFNSKVNLEGIDPVKRLAVVSHVRNKHFDGEVYESFERQVTEGLKACGVVPAMLSPGGMDVDGPEKANALLAEFKPDAVLVIKGAGGTFTWANGGQISSPILDLELHDVRAKRVTWRARSTFEFQMGGLFPKEDASGKRLADQLVARLGEDGVLKGCAPPP